MKLCNIAEAHRPSPSSFIWWREVSALAFTSAHAHQLTRDLARVFDSVDLGDSRRDSVAAAVGRAIRIVRDQSASIEDVDAAMSLSLLYALRGDMAAREVIIFGLRRRRSAASDLIADGWCVAPAFQKVRASPSAHRRRPRMIQRQRRWRRMPTARGR
jgi:hypothetical protein